MIGIVLVLVLLLVLNVMMNALNIIAISGIITIMAYKYKNIFKKAYLYYIAAFIISGVSLYFYKEPYLRIINGGLIGYGFMFTVMFAGVFPNRWGLTRALKKNRGVFSILSFIFITPHAVSHFFGLVGGVNIFGLIAYIIMVPLTLISFRIIRKEINPKDWFTIQKAAYLIYAALFTHLLLVASWENKIIYAVMATLYINNKLVKELNK